MKAYQADIAKFSAAGYQVYGVSADSVFALMMDCAREQGTAFVVVTHDAALAARCGATLQLAR